MINIYCAIYKEARALIRAFGLKKEIKHKHFQVFFNETAGVRLVITGAGSVAAATAVAEISTAYPPEKTDLLINFGSCAAGEEIAAGDVFLCNKITEAPTGRTFYPDMIYRHPFSESEIISVPKVMSREEMKDRGTLCDMEAAAVYQAGNYYYSPHQMLFIKIVTDHGVAYNEKVEVQEYTHLLYPFINKLKEAADGEVSSEALRREIRIKAKEDAHRLAEEMHCSVTMTAELDQLLFYCRLTGKDYADLIREYKSRGQLPAKDKREGKRILEEFKAKLL